MEKLNQAEQLKLKHLAHKCVDNGDNSTLIDIINFYKAQTALELVEMRYVSLFQILQRNNPDLF